MSELARMAAEYFQLGGYWITRQTPDFFDAETEIADDAPARVLIWADDTVLTPSASLSSAEKAQREASEFKWLQRFARETKDAPGAVGYFLVPQRLGLSAQFVTAATKRLRGGIRVPVEFFDTAYRADEGGRRARTSVAGAVFEEAARIKRVPQPFFRRQALGENGKSPVQGDIAAYLKTWIATAGQRPRFCLIDGSAGAGKTVAFNALATYAHQAFIELKRRQGKDSETGRTAARPIIFLPQHLRGEGKIGPIDDIIAAANATDMAAPVTPDQLRWLLVNGFNLWMFDGLDEFYEGSEGFFGHIKAALDAPGSKACILICTRDSLLTSSAAMRAFVESRLSTAAGDTEILELAPWDESAWRTIAAIEFGEGAKAQKFVSLLTASPVVADLARLPFYCSVLIELFKNGGTLPASEYELLDTVFERMIEREHDKAIFRWQDFVDEDLLSAAIEEEIGKIGGLKGDDARTRKLVSGLLDEQGKENVAELLSALAHAYHRSDAQSGAGAGLDAHDIEALTDISYVANDLTQDAHLRRLNTLVHFAFFGAGRRAGSVDFTHPILAGYLAARYALFLLRRGMAALPQGTALHPSDYAMPKAAIQQAAGTAPLDPDSIFVQYILRELGEDRELADFLKSMATQPFERENVKAFMAAILTAH
ncbi:MAG: hypothetical protein ACLP7P_19985 [Rhodomicrobium sp.]